MSTLAASVESWDEDQDFDFSSTPSSHFSLHRSDIGSHSSEAHEKNEETGRPVVVKLKGQHGLDANEEEENDDDEQGDTLKVSDLTSQTLAQLASYAKKSFRNPSGAQEQEQDILFNDTLPKEEVDDWTEGLDVPDTLSLRPLDVRKGSVASDIDFETPSLDSISDFTSSSSQSEAVKSLGGPSTPYKNRVRGMLSSASSATSSSQLSPSRHAASASAKRMYGDSSKLFGDEVERTSDEVRVAISSKAANTIAPRDSSLHVAPPSIGSMRSSDGARTAGEEAEVYDDLTFDSFEADGDGKEEGEKSSTNLAEHLQARLASRKGQRRNVMRDADHKDMQGLEKDFSSGLVIEDDLDISPSRLRARALSSRLREAAYSRRRKQDDKRQDDWGQSVDVKTNSDPVSRESAGQRLRERDAVTPSHYHASTAASRAREAEIRASSPVQSVRATQMNDARSNSASPSRSASPFQGRDSPLGKGWPSSSASGPHSRDRPTMTQERTGSSHPPHPYARTDSKARRDGAKSGKALRIPHRVRNYGDGRELDGIEDLKVRDASDRKTGDAKRGKASVGSTLRADQQTKDRERNAVRRETIASDSASPSPVPIRKPRSRKKKQPHLIRNLSGDAGTTAKMVGDMRWNPLLKRWEGNEQEGREFDNAVRGTGRPALITRLSLGSSGIALGGAITSPPPQRLSSHLSPPHSSAELGRTRDAASATSGSPHVVGEMMFDSVQLRWVRQDGKEEADPFDEVWDMDVDEASENDYDRQSGEEDDGLALAQRRVRQRTVSAEYRASNVDRERSTDEKVATTAVAVGDVQRLIVDSLRLARSASQPPVQLREAIPNDLWASSVEAQRRHEREMSGFFPPSRQDATQSRPTRNVGLGHLGKGSSVRLRPHSTAPEVVVASASQHGQLELGGGGVSRHLYLIQSLSRREVDRR